MSSIKDDMPLYGKDGTGNIFINIYPPAECMRCGVLARNMYYREVATTDSTYFSRGSLFLVESSRVCDKCFNNDSSVVWG